MADILLRRLFSQFLIASLSIVLARVDDSTEKQLQYYLDIRKIFVDFSSGLPTQLERLEGGARIDLLKKYSSLLVFEFEAAARLKAWDSLEHIIKVHGSTRYHSASEANLCLGVRAV